jgi:hypothetical protein
VREGESEGCAPCGEWAAGCVWCVVYFCSTSLVFGSAWNCSGLTVHVHVQHVHEQQDGCFDLKTRTA